MSAESLRLIEDASRDVNWKRWGPYLSERQWGTVREDYSENGDCWEYFPHDQARSRAYRWGEDGLLGITDRECRLCFSLALWNGRDPILKERLFGLTNGEGNHGEDVKECYYYLDAIPSNSYLRGLYKYPQMEFPYGWLVEENRRRGKFDPEFELADTGAFNENRYFDILIEYAKNSPNDILIRITASNRGPETAKLHLLPTIWYRNTWSWGCKHEGCWPKPRIAQADSHSLIADHVTLKRFHFVAGDLSVGNQSPSQQPTWLFTENETNHARLFSQPNYSPYVKDSFHDYLIHDKSDAVNPKMRGTKAAAHYDADIAAGASVTLRLRLCADDELPWAHLAKPATREKFSRGNGSRSAAKTTQPKNPGLDKSVADGFTVADKLTSVEATAFDQVFTDRRAEADEYYAEHIPSDLSAAEQVVARQAYAGLLWSKQFYEYIVKDWIEGDPDQPTPPAARINGRNSDWSFLHNRDIISMPDKWEYPWYAAWDLAFHLVALGRVDVQFAMDQAVLFLREWYMHPNGQLPAYEFALSDVNPPVHAWAVWRLYKMSGPKRQRDRLFLARCFQKLLINFTWWVNRKDYTGRNLFSGGFLGMDNIGLFDRSQPLPPGVLLLQADGTAWMATYCLIMLSMAMELANDDPAYEDVASKFFEHFVAIVDAMNTFGGTGLWDEQDGFYYDAIHIGGKHRHLRARSMVGLIPLLAVTVLEDEIMDRLPSFKKRVNWFLENRKDLSRHISYCEQRSEQGRGLLLAIPTRERLERVLRYMLDETEFLSPYGIRSLSRFHEEHPCSVHSEFGEFNVNYDPGESTTSTFGGNSNWRGPIWFPVNYAILEALQRYHYFYGDSLKVECPTGSGRWMNLDEVAVELSQRLVKLFLPDAQGRRPCHGDDRRYAEDPHWRDLILFYEYFHGDNGRGCGASHQTGWTALVVRLLDKFLRRSHPQALGTPQPTSLTASWGVI